MIKLFELKKKYAITLIVISLIVIAALFISISYAYWKISGIQIDTNIANSACFNVTFEETGQDITLQNAFPISDEKGLKVLPYKFKLKNVCSADAKYAVTINSFGDRDTLLSEEAIKIAFGESNITPDGNKQY